MISANEAISWYGFLATLAMEWWFIRSVGTTLMSYATRMMYRSYLHNNTKLSKESIEKKNKGIVVFSHIGWTLIFTWLARRNDILEYFNLVNMKNAVYDIRVMQWDLFFIEIIIFLCVSLVIFSLWENIIYPIIKRKMLK